MQQQCMLFKLKSKARLDKAGAKVFCVDNVFIVLNLYFSTHSEQELAPFSPESFGIPEGCQRVSEPVLSPLLYKSITEL